MHADKLKFKALLGLAAVAAIVWFAPKPADATPVGPSYCSPCLFYGGDPDLTDPNAGWLSNEKDLAVSQSAIYTPFVVPNGETWDVTGLFTNNLINNSVLSADWEIRTGLSPGNGGTLRFSGADMAPVVTDTSISLGGSEVYAVSVAGLGGISLDPGMYWLSVVPVCLDSTNAICYQQSWQATANGINAFGPPEPQNGAFWNSSFWGQDFTAIPGTWSAGVIGTGSIDTGNDTGTVPEPSSTFAIFGLGLLLIGLFAGVRRRMS